MCLQNYCQNLLQNRKIKEVKDYAIINDRIAYCANYHRWRSRSSNLIIYAKIFLDGACFTPYIIRLFHLYGSTSFFLRRVKYYFKIGMYLQQNMITIALLVIYGICQWRLYKNNTEI